MDEKTILETESDFKDAQVVNLDDPDVKAAIKEAKKRIHDTSEDIVQQLSVAMKDPEFRDRLRELHPNLPDELKPKRDIPPVRTGKGQFTKPKINAPKNRKRNKAASKARKKGK